MLAHWLAFASTSIYAFTTVIGKNVQSGVLCALGSLLFSFGTALRNKLPLREDKSLCYPTRLPTTEKSEPSVGTFVTAANMTTTGARFTLGDTGPSALQSRSSYPLA